MSRITTVSPATGPAADALAVTKGMFGSVPNMFATAAQAPAALVAMNHFFAALGTGTLGAKLGEQIAIAVAQANDCGYCLSAHSHIGRLHGLDANQLADAKHGRAADPRAQAAISLALEINRTHGRVSDVALATARSAGLTDGEIVEVVAHVALNIFTNSLNNVADTAIDFPVIALEKAA